MIYTGQGIIDRARYVLQDVGAVAWTAPEVLLWLNDARSKAYELRPDWFTVEEDQTLVEGSRQTVPNGSTRLAEVMHNVSHRSKRQITLVGDEILSRIRPGWRALKKSTEILHYIYDERDGGDYEVYPPAAVGVVVRVKYDARPAAITDLNAQLVQEADGAQAYVDYVLSRSFQKESSANPGYDQRAANHLAMFMQALSVTGQTKVLGSPNAQKEGGTPPNLGS